MSDDLKQHIAVLRDLNLWRRWNDSKMTDPTEVCIAIDTVCDAVDELMEAADHLKAVIDERDALLADKPRRMGNWKQSLLAYIELHRMQIFADIIHMLDNAAQLECDPVTRFPEFEEAILRGVCADYEEYAVAIAAINESKQSSNVEEEHARVIEDEFAARLSDANRRTGSEMIFIRSEVVRKWMEEILPEIPAGMQYIRNLAKNGLTPRFSAKPDRFPNRGPQRRRGIMWIPQVHDGGSPLIVGIKNGKIIEVIA